MAETHSCPQCGQAVTAPDESDAQQLVACPHCHGRFRLEELGETIQRLGGSPATAPEVVPVHGPPRPEGEADPGAADGPHQDSGILDFLEGVEPEAAEAAAATEEPGQSEPAETPEDSAAEAHQGQPVQQEPANAEEPPVETEPAEEEEEKEEETPESPPDRDPWVRSPQGGDAFRLSQLVLASTGQPLGPEAAAWIADRLRAPGGTGAEGDLPAELAFLDRQADEPPQIDFGPGAGAPASSLAARPRRRKQKSVIRELVGIVLGGAAGLIIAYYGLNYFGKKERFNFLKIYLPGVAHTEPYKPAWWPGGGSDEAAGRETSAAPAPEAGKRRPAGAGRRTNRPPRTPKTPAGSAAPQAEPPGQADASPLPFEMPDAALEPAPESDEPPELPAAEPGLSLPEVPLPIQPAGSAPAREGPPEGPAPKTVAPGEEPTEDASQGAGRRIEAAGQTGQGEPAPEATPPAEPQAPTPPVPLTAAAYEQLCQLGHTITATDADPDQDGSITQLLRAVGEAAENVRQIARFAQDRVDQDATASAGILLAGKVEQTVGEGKGLVARVKMASVQKWVVVIGQRSLDLAPGDRVLVLGRLQADPRREPAWGELAEGAAAAVVLAGRVVTF